MTYKNNKPYTFSLPQELTVLAFTRFKNCVPNRTAGSGIIPAGDILFLLNYVFFCSLHVCVCMFLGALKLRESHFEWSQFSLFRSYAIRPDKN